jgi:hypothetical protein
MVSVPHHVQVRKMAVGVLMLVLAGSTCGLQHLDVSWLVSALFCVSTLFRYTATAAVISARHVAGVADDHDG